ncbi:LysR family transcriptional regulator [Brevibacillus fluminis]|uniref:LysR family transcriptional regulator n=1 Tax=Brevibacillus fluminis TaxID=511487 RepID=A0A3M8CV79_9BACL|nr:LysR family transcriptional regulator [Brevibacillus fluminis]RNB79732.1 LysR family transcriptional regulator [Brevibacillus fluminis]
MDVKVVKTFHLLAKYGSFIRVAEETNYAQSTITMQIQKLEADLGVQLIERGKKIRLTEAGRLFYEQSLHVIQSMEQLQANLSDFRLGEAGHVRLGVTEPTASYRLPTILKRFISRYPKICVSLDIANTPALSERLLRGDIDVALCSAPDLGTELYFEPLFKEEFAVLLPEDHPLAGKAAISPEEIRGYRLLITSATCPYRRKLEVVLQGTGGIPIDTMEIGSMTALKYYVACGFGIALVPKIVLDPAPQGTTVRAVDGNPIDMTFGMLSKTPEYPQSLAAAKLMSFLKEELHAPSSMFM